MFLQRELEEEMLRKNELVSVVKQMLLEYDPYSYIYGIDPSDAEKHAKEIVDTILSHIRK